MLLFFTTGFQQSQLREQPLIQLCNHKCFPSISNIFRTWHFIMGSKKLPLLKTHIFLKTILKIVVAVVVDSFDEFCRFSVLQTLSGFLIHLKKKVHQTKVNSEEKVVDGSSNKSEFYEFVFFHLHLQLFIIGVVLVTWKKIRLTST